MYIINPKQHGSRIIKTSTQNYSFIWFSDFPRIHVHVRKALITFVHGYFSSSKSYWKKNRKKIKKEEKNIKKRHFLPSRGFCTRIQVVRIKNPTDSLDGV